MQLPLRVLLTLFAVGLAAGAAHAVEVSSHLSSATARVDEEVVLTITVRDAQVVKTPIVPRVDTMEIELVGLPSQSTGMNVINGRMTQWTERSYRFAVMPKTLDLPVFNYARTGAEREAAKRGNIEIIWRAPESADQITLVRQ